MHEIQNKAADALAPKIVEKTVYVGELTLTVKAEDLYWALQSLKEQFGFDYLADIYTVDHYRDEQRFEVGYNLFNLSDKVRIRVKTFVEEDNPVLESIVPLWPSANWNEREAWDMMGIKFRNHPDLRRIYMPEDFEFHPHRKEFPLIGIPGSIQMPEKDPPKGYK